jgi:sporulation protein YlmC with PRC-barrel domain
MGDKVISTEGEDLGKFEDLMIDLAEGRIAYAALSFGGFLGMGDKLFAIPWKALTLRVHEHAFVLDIPKEVLENAVGFDKDNWPATSRESLSSIYNYYGYQPYWQTETTRSRYADNAGFLRANKIRGEKVYNRENDHIGKIEDIMIDLQDGRIAYAVILHGGLLGIGSKHIPIPWQAFSLAEHDNAFVVDIPKEILDKAEGLDKDKWPVTREELSRTFSYYGYKPYWQMGAAGLAGATAAATMRGTREPETTRMEPERMDHTETTAEEPIRTGEPSEASAERERLEILKAEEENRLSQLEKDLEEARRQEETEKVTQLEEEFKRVSSQEQAQRERLAQLERERMELERQTETEKERLARLEREKRMET